MKSNTKRWVPTMSSNFNLKLMTWRTMKFSGKSKQKTATWKRLTMKSRSTALMMAAEKHFPENTTYSSISKVTRWEWIDRAPSATFAVKQSKAFTRYIWRSMRTRSNFVATIAAKNSDKKLLLITTVSSLLLYSIFQLLMQFCYHFPVLIHKNEKPHECPWCNKRFRQKYTMQHHIKNRHTGVKDHICGKSLSHLQLARKFSFDFPFRALRKRIQW